jgi:hypothetical protein
VTVKILPIVLFTALIAVNHITLRLDVTLASLLNAQNVQNVGLGKQEGSSMMGS